MYLQNRHFFQAFPFHFAVGEIPLSIKICLALKRETGIYLVAKQHSKKFNARIMIYKKTSRLSTKACHLDMKFVRVLRLENFHRRHHHHFIFIFLFHPS